MRVNKRVNTVWSSSMSIWMVCCCKVFSVICMTALPLPSSFFLIRDRCTLLYPKEMFGFESEGQLISDLKCSSLANKLKTRLSGALRHLLRWRFGKPGGAEERVLKHTDTRRHLGEWQFELSFGIMLQERKIKIFIYHEDFQMYFLE